MQLRRLATSSCDGPFGSAIKSDHYVDSGARVVRLGNIGSAKWNDSNAAFLDIDYWRSLVRHHVEPGDLLIAGLGDEGNPVGRATTAPPHLARALVKADCYRVRLSTSDPRFVAYYLSSPPGLAQAWMVAEGSTRPRLTLGKALALKVPAPPLAIQRNISDYLDDETARIDALITKKRRMIDLLDEAWRSLRTSRTIGSVDAVTGRGQAPPEAQAMVNLGVLIELQRGHDLPADEREKGNIPIVSSGGVSGYHSTPAASGPGVVTGRYGTIGEVFYVEEDYWPLNTTLYVKDFRGNDPRWVSHMLAALPLDAEKDKSAVTGINRNVIGQLRVPRPPFKDQVRIGSQLEESRSRSEKTIEKLNSQIDLLAERRQALITAAVTGELEIPGVAA